MEKSERLVLLLFFLAMAGIFWVLYLLLGGDSHKEPEVPVALDSDLEFLVDDEDDSDRDNEPSRLRSQAPKSVSAQEGLDREPGRSFSSLGSSGASASSRKPGFHSILKKYRRKAKRLPLPRRQAKLRSRLRSKGFRNQEYIEMKVLALDRKTADEAIRQAAKIGQDGDAGKALALLGRELETTNPENLQVRGKLIQAIIAIAMERGYPDTVLNYQQQLIAIQDRINAIKRSTILMDNPLAQKRLERERELISKWQANPEAFKNGVESMRENRGFSPETWQALQANSLNAGRQMGDPTAEAAARTSFKDLRSRVSKNWANPKSGDPTRE